MPKFVIERDIPAAGSLSSEQLQAMSQKSCGILRAMGSQIQWVQSYVADHNFTAYTWPPMKKRYASMPNKAAFQLTESRKFGR